MPLFSNLFMDNPEVLLVAGIIVMTASLMLHLRKRHRQAAKNKAERQAAAATAREAERKRQVQKGERAKTRPSSLAPDRVPSAEPYDHTFTGAVSPSSIAKWEAEIHQIGRQILGQIDSKMVVLQTLTLEANRTANRMELLLEHLEQIVNKKADTQTSTPIQVSSDHSEHNNGPAVGVPVKKPHQATKTLQNAPADSPTEKNLPGKEQTESLPHIESLMPVVEKSPENYTHSNLISAESSTGLAAYTDILNELDAELEQINAEANFAQSAPSDSVLPATIIKAPPSPAPSQSTASREVPPRPAPITPAIAQIPSAVSLGSDSPLLLDPFSLSSPRLPGDLSLLVGKERTSSTSTRPKTIQTSSNRLPLDTVFERGSGVKTHTQEQSLTGHKTSLSPTGSRLALREQVKTLADYGYTANQIAQNLNITVGEVDLMISIGK